MGHSYNYSVIQFAAHHLRNERLNVGLAIFGEDGLEVRPAKQFEKLKAISSAIDPSMVRASVMRLPELDSYTTKRGNSDIRFRIDELRALTAMDFSPLGEFFAPNSEVFETQVENILKKLVEPEPAPPKKVVRRPTRLRSDLKALFRSRKVLARKGEGPEAHRILVNHEIAEGLSADFFLKNGKMHVIESIDASSMDSSITRAVSHIAVSALVFEQARMTHGNRATETQLIYKASAALETALTPSLSAAEHQGASLINWESDSDKDRFVSKIVSLAEPIEDKRARKARIHASSQHKLTLN